MWKPKEKEKEKEFITRCMKNPNIIKEFKTQKQRLAVCYPLWKERK